MTRVFTEDGESWPVTVIEVAPNRVTQIKDIDTDGYRAVQITTGSRRAKLLSKARAGHFAKAGVDAGRGLWEFRLDADEGADLEVGSELKVGRFDVGQKLDVRGCTIGKGFAGVVKRYNFHMQDATHGNSLAHRAPGSIGQNQTPGRVFKGKKMSGHMGNVMRTTQNLEVVRVDEERNFILLKGAVPGPRGGDVVLSRAVKAQGSPSA
jgi:large subunit ribosomal protein L3